MEAISYHDGLLNPEAGLLQDGISLCLMVIAILEEDC
jgi:hypothetical protein